MSARPKLTVQQRLMLDALADGNWWTGPQLAVKLSSYPHEGRTWTSQGVHQTLASLVFRGRVEKTKATSDGHRVVLVRLAPAVSRGQFTAEEVRIQDSKLAARYRATERARERASAREQVLR